MRVFEFETPHYDMETKQYLAPYKYHIDCTVDGELFVSRDDVSRRIKFKSVPTCDMVYQVQKTQVKSRYESAEDLIDDLANDFTNMDLWFVVSLIRAVLGVE